MGLFELHCHSKYSKGRKISAEGIASPEEIIRKAKEIGLSGIAITDHFTNLGWKAAEREAKKQGIIFIPGIEIETQAGHILGLGLTESVKSGLPLEETLDRIREQGAVSVAPHPFDVYGKGVREGYLKADAAEVFNALALDRLTNKFCARAAGNAGKPAVCGSDAHTLDMIGLARNVIDAQDVDSVLKAIRKGDVSIDARYAELGMLVDWTRERMIESYAELLDYINTNYSMPKAWIAKRSLRSFTIARRRYWNWFADVGLGLVAFYGGLKVISYYW